MERLKRVIPYFKGVGLIISLASVYFLVSEQTAVLRDIRGVAFNPVFLGGAAASLFLILLGYIFHSLLLWKILGLLRVDIEMKDAFISNLRPQIAKYIPGGIFQISGSAAMLMSRVSMSKALIALAAQTALLIVVSLVIGLPVFIGLAYPLSGVVPGFMALVLIAYVLLSFLIKSSDFFQNYLDSRNLLSNLIAIACPGLFFFAAAGFSFYLLINMLFPPGIDSAINVMGAFSISWSAGMVIIGSPGGMGIREIVLGSLLNIPYSNTEFGMTLLLHRIIWICADVILLVIPYDRIPEKVWSVFAVSSVQKQYEGDL